MLLIGERKIVQDLDLNRNHLLVLLKGEKDYRPVPFSALSWVPDDWELESRGRVVKNYKRKKKEPSRV
jgi:hypothetical protein